MSRVLLCLLREKNPSPFIFSSSSLLAPSRTRFQQILQQFARTSLARVEFGIVYHGQHTLGVWKESQHIRSTTIHTKKQYSLA